MEKRAVLLLWFGLCVMACSTGKGTSVERSAATQASATPQSLTSSGEQELRAIIESGRLSDLQWPNFSPEQSAVKEFYEQSGHRLGWISAGRPTPQALKVSKSRESLCRRLLRHREIE